MPGTATPTYDLVLLLDTAAEQKARTAILAEVERSIAGGGELVRHDRWGERALAYPIGHRDRADYHLFQFHPREPELLRGLDRSLRIADEVIRFRIVKLKPGTPEPPESLRADRAGETEAPGRAGPSAPAPAGGEEHAPEAGAQPSQEAVERSEAGGPQPQTGAAQPQTGAAQPQTGAAQPQTGAAQPQSGQAGTESGQAGTESGQPEAVARPSGADANPSGADADPSEADADPSEAAEDPSEAAEGRTETTPPEPAAEATSSGG
jgi:small subunit ribosomal protein S6